MTWINTESSRRTERWVAEDTQACTGDIGLAHREWFNIDTGAGYLLACDGDWRTGGKFHLLFKAPGQNTATDVSQLLWPTKTAFSADAQVLSQVRSDLLTFIDHLLGSKSLSSMGTDEQ